MRRIVAFIPMLVVLTATSIHAGSAPLQAEETSSASAPLACRQGDMKQRMLNKYGGNKKTEAAVAAGLEWIVAHQLPDGGWSFDLRLAPGCDGKCSHSGDAITARNAATAMALLPLLGAGHSPSEGPYAKAIQKGLTFLAGAMKPDGSLFESSGNMYSHGLATIALCEAATLDPKEDRLKQAQKALDYISQAQDPVGGGWRYMPRQSGDTSVTGWQVAALYAGRVAGLKVEDRVMKQADHFLASVSSEDGAYYGYTTPTKRETTTAMGLLSRSYLGWGGGDDARERGVKWLAMTGPSRTNMYANYYEAQVLRAYGGKTWKRWNREMRRYLLPTQRQEGHEAGSWDFGNTHFAARAGRLYVTSMALLILETYYRYPAD